MNDISSRLRQLRKQQGLTQKQMGELLGISHVGYSSYERSHSVPPIENWIKITETFHTSVQYIITGEECSEEYIEGESAPFPQRLAEIRKNKKMTQVKVAKALDVEEATYQCYEYGMHKPNLEKLVKLSRLFEVTLDELIGRNKK